MMKKALAFTTIIAIIILGITLYNNYKQMKSSSENNNTMQNNKKAEEFINTYPEEYAGAYIDEEGILNINVVGEGQNIKKIMQGSNVKFHSVEYSLQQLSEVNDSLCDRLIELGISAMELDQANNKVIVYLENPDDTKKIDNIKKIVDSPAIEYKKFESEIKY